MPHPQTSNFQMPSTLNDQLNNHLCVAFPTISAINTPTPVTHHISFFYLLACAIAIPVYFISPWPHNKFPSNIRLPQARQVPIKIYLTN